VIRALKWVGHLVFENLGWKLLSLAAAVVIWALVAGEPELSTFTAVRLAYKNIPEDLEMVSDPVESVVLELRGPSGELRSMSDGVRPEVVLDMSGARPGERTYPIGGNNVKVPRGLRVVRVIPGELRFRFEARRERMVPVEARLVGAGQNGYEVARSEVTPREVRISGPRSRVARVTSVITDQVDVSNVVGVSEFHVSVFVEDPFIRLLDPPEVTVTVSMKKKR
jgi:YbbR domain-containing protein